jgi:hypothetical protein
MNEWVWPSSMCEHMGPLYCLHSYLVNLEQGPSCEHLSLANWGLIFIVLVVTLNKGFHVSTWAWLIGD